MFSNPTSHQHLSAYPNEMQTKDPTLSDTTSMLIRIRVEGAQIKTTPALAHPRGNTLIWFFHGVPEGYEPALDFVRFKPLRGRSRRPVNLKPFQYWLRDHDKIVGKGLRRWPGTYQYEVLLVPVDEGGGSQLIRLEPPPGEELRLEIEAPLG